MRIGDAPVCPGCWSLDGVAVLGEYVCPNPRCLTGWFDAEDPRYQPQEMLLLVDTVIGPAKEAA